MKTKIIGKMWFIMIDLSVSKFNINDDGHAVSTSGMHEQIIYAKGNRFCTKREAVEVARKVKESFKTIII